MDSLFTMREAQQDDLDIISSFAHGEGMPSIPSIDNVTVAVNEDEDVVGFIRLAFNEEGVAHVNPVVVYPTWRGFGVGKALVEHALERYGELRLVSRGNSLAFYRALGFTDVDWAFIHAPIAEECTVCELIDECKPRPVAKKKEGAYGLPGSD